MKSRNPPTVSVDRFHRLVTESAIGITKIWPVLLNNFLRLSIKVSRGSGSMFHDRSLTQFGDFVFEGDPLSYSNAHGA